MEENKNIETVSFEFKHGIVSVDINTIILTVDDPMESDYVCVIEVYNSAKYGVPHFVFTSKKRPRDFTQDEIKDIYVACNQAWPGFDVIVEDEVYCDDNVPGKFFDKYGNPKTSAEFMEGPWIGIFLFDAQCKGVELPEKSYSIQYNTEEARISLLKLIAS